MFGCSGMCWLINLQGVFVPSGSMTMMAFAIFGSTSWGTSELAILFATHAASTGVGAYLWMLLARRYKTTRLLAAAGAAQAFYGVKVQRSPRYYLANVFSVLFLITSFNFAVYVVEMQDGKGWEGT